MCHTSLVTIYMYVCMHQLSIHLNFSVCACDISCDTQNPVRVFLYLCCSLCRTRPNSSLWRWIQVISAWHFCLWLNLGLVNSHHALLFLLANNCENKLEQSVTANQSESQEAEPRVRVKHGAEAVFVCHHSQPWATRRTHKLPIRSQVSYIKNQVTSNTVLLYCWTTALNWC